MTQIADDLPVAAPAVRSYRGLDAAVMIAGCLTFVLMLFTPQILNDGDTLWQITTGNRILDHRAIPSTDPFSFTAGGRHWFAHEWLAETLMALSYRAGGMRGVMVLAAAAGGLTAAVLLHQLRKFLPGVYALTGLIVGLSNAAPSVLARPHLLAWPCLAVWCTGLLVARENRTAPSFGLLPIMLLWVNLHGSFMFGLLLSGVFMVEALIDPTAGRRRLVAARTWAGFILGAWATALINPDFAAGVMFPIHLIGMQSLVWIGEWAPPDFSVVQPVEVIIVGALGLGLLGKLVLPPVRLLIFLGLIHGALTHTRGGQLLGIVGTLVLAEPLGAALGRGGAEPLSSSWRGLAAGMALMAMAGVVTRVVLPLGPERSGALFAAVVQAVPARLRGEPVLNEYGIGGGLIFNGIRPFIDSRADLYGDTFLSQYHRIAGGDRAELDRVLAENHIVWSIFPAGHLIASMMGEKPGWRRLVDTNGFVVHVRDDTAPD